MTAGVGVANPGGPPELCCPDSHWESITQTLLTTHVVDLSLQPSGVGGLTHVAQNPHPCRKSIVSRGSGWVQGPRYPAGRPQGSEVPSPGLGQARPFLDPQGVDIPGLQS